MGKMQRNKGAGFERWTVNKLKPLFPEAVRILEYQSHMANGVDVETAKFAVQCKAYAKYPPISKIEEINSDKTHLLIAKGNHKKPVVVMYLDDWLKIMEDIGEAHE